MYTLYWIKDPQSTDPFTEGYVGLTKREPETRFQEHVERKDLPENVEMVILAKGTEQYISHLEETYRPHSHIGWNLSKGGLSGGRPTGIHTSGWTQSQEANQKRREASTGERNGMYGKATSEKQKRAVGESARKRFTGVPKNYKVTNHVMHGKDNPKSRAVVVGDETYATVTKAAKAHGVSRVTARRRLTVDTFPEWRYAE